MLNGFVILICLISGATSQEQVNLIVNSTQVFVMYKSDESEPYNSSFVEASPPFKCSLTVLYTYSQNQNQLKDNTEYYVTIKSVSQNLSITTSTAYSIFQPSINASSCSPGDDCTIAIRNNCPNPVGFFDYFDRVTIHIQNLNPLTYNVICNNHFTTNTFEWGLLILIFFVTILISIVAIYSKAWSLGGSGIVWDIPMIIGFNFVLILGGILAIFSRDAASIGGEVFSWIFGIFGVGLCFNEIIYLLKLDFLQISWKIKQREIRVMDGISFLVGLGVCFGWWFSNKNWIVSDIVSICMIVAFIKVLKFTQLKMAVISYFVTITVQMIFVIVINFVISQSYNNIVLNQFNDPFLLQLPTINAVYNQKCAWLPITAIVYPGALMSYMRRFDTSRNTKVYLITCVVLFFFGSILWMFVSIISPYSWPFGLIAQPATIGLVSFFAWKRKQIRTLWEGIFYDEEFANKQSIDKLNEMIEFQRTSRMSYQESMFRGLQLKVEESMIDRDIRKTQKKDEQK